MEFTSFLNKQPLLGGKIGLQLKEKCFEKAKHTYEKLGSSVVREQDGLKILAVRVTNNLKLQIKFKSIDFAFLLQKQTTYSNFGKNRSQIT